MFESYSDIVADFLRSIDTMKYTSDTATTVAKIKTMCNMVHIFICIHCTKSSGSMD